MSGGKGAMGTGGGAGGARVDVGLLGSADAERLADPHDRSLWLVPHPPA